MFAAPSGIAGTARPFVIEGEEPLDQRCGHRLL